jgi:hypothetical protein
VARLLSTPVAKRMNLGNHRQGTGKGVSGWGPLRCGGADPPRTQTDAVRHDQLIQPHGTRLWQG